MVSEELRRHATQLPRRALLLPGQRDVPEQRAYDGSPNPNRNPDHNPNPEAYNDVILVGEGGWSGTRALMMIMIVTLHQQQ